MFYLGGDFSYINEVEDSGGRYSDVDGQAGDPFEIFRRHGANIARVRLWHTPTWTPYSNLKDVVKTLRRARAAGMALMLDFHYSDTWADPGKQIIPVAWQRISDLDELQRALYVYTLETLLELNKLDLMPEFVQVGNEINTEILRPENTPGYPINWPRNAALINAGVKAVRAAGQLAANQPQVMLHIAQPENLLPWFDAALEAGVNDFDQIGLSYYPKWSVHSIAETAQMIVRGRECYGKELMVVETAYPWTQAAGQVTDHLLGEDAVTPAYPATTADQYRFLTDFTQAVADAGGNGVVYWEPAWISTTSKPSIWENAALFDYNGQAHEGIKFLSHDYKNVPGKSAKSF